MTNDRTLSVALLYPGDRAARARADAAESRFGMLFDAFAAAGVRAEPAVYHDDFADEVAAQLRSVDGVLVWCNPIEAGRRRDRLDAMLREVARDGVLVSADPDTILRLGTKDVLFETRDLPFGSDVHRVDSLSALESDLPARLRSGPRVLKQHRGHSGIGVWRVEWADEQLPTLRLRHAQLGSEEEIVAWPTFLQRMAPYFDAEQGGHMIDQAWQRRLTDGMVRAYLVEDRVTGFGHQAVNALYPSPAGKPAVQPGPRLYHGPEEPLFQGLKHCLESGWIVQLSERVAVPPHRLPLLWDCDFIFGEAQPDASSSYVLCEVNASSVSPFPPASILPLVEATARRLRGVFDQRAGGELAP